MKTRWDLLAALICYMFFWLFTVMIGIEILFWLATAGIFVIIGSLIFRRKDA